MNTFTNLPTKNVYDACEKTIEYLKQRREIAIADFIEVLLDGEYQYEEKNDFSLFSFPKRVYFKTKEDVLKYLNGSKVDIEIHNLYRDRQRMFHEQISKLQNIQNLCKVKDFVGDINVSSEDFSYIKSFYER